MLTTFSATMDDVTLTRFSPAAFVPGALPYHRLARSTDAYRWWRPLVVGIVGVVFYGIFIVGCVIAMLIARVISPDIGTALDAFTRGQAALDLSNPAVFAFTLLSLIYLLPSLFIAQLLAGTKPVGLLSSVAGRVRWGLLLRCLGIAAMVFALSQGVSSTIAAFSGDGIPAPLGISEAALPLALTLLLVPFQAAAEEYVFRGYLMQTIGGWLRHPLFAILLPVPLFVIAHGYDPLGQTSVAVFAIIAGWLTWRTGGLEAAIGLHIVNNVSVFGLGAFGLVDANASSLGIIDLIITIATTLVYATVVVWLFRRGRRAATRQPGMPG
ncbi:CPBP family intramembrane glutamic endopeptidase [Paramicrobacterium fandaimingii]|uniref:CPBP family intramembrane glutamic endopeptidase n=1 Tax=Paramicrobacterium fandaimingii TaxID=2708079 RepID=UPI001423569C|nr:type II CAAX endopeptidase family protein [Microbacterium fandaimingii]